MLLIANSGGAVVCDTINGNVIIPTNISATAITEPEPICFRVEIPETNFTGRELELSILKDVMKQSSNLSNPKTHTAIVAGLGGIGKTQLVRQFINQNQKSYKNIIWIDAEKLESIKEAFQILAVDRLNISTNNADGGKKDFKSIVQHVLSKLCSGKTLFVYDNVDEIEIMKFLLKFVLTMETLGENLHVIITSRIQEWNSANLIKLNVWEVDDAIKYVMATLNDHNDSNDDKKLLVETLQYFPLALRQATAHINNQRIFKPFQIIDYVNKYDTQEALDSKFFQDFSCYEKTTYTTWKITIDTIERDGAIGRLAVRILRIIAHFDPDHIHRDIFIHLVNKPENSLINILLSTLKRLKLFRGEEIDYQENVRSAVRLLVNYSIIDSQQVQSVLSVHRLVQRVIKKALENASDKGKKVLRDGLMLISKLIEDENLRENIDHGIAVFLSALNFNDLVEEFRTILRYIIDNLNYYGKYNRAIAFGDSVLHTLTNILGEDHVETLGTKYGIGKSYEELRKYTESLEIYQEVLDKQKNILGVDHPSTLNTKYHMGKSFNSLGKPSQALEMFEEVLKKRKDILGKDHLDTLTTEHDIAYTYILLGKRPKALRIYQELIVKQNYILAVDKPDAFPNKHDIAYSYMQLGKHSEALEIFQALFEMKKNILGENHPDTLITKHMIACVYGELGKHSEALEIYKENLDKQRNILGEYHRDTRISKHNIAYSYNQLGKHSEL